MARVEGRNPYSNSDRLDRYEATVMREWAKATNALMGEFETALRELPEFRRAVGVEKLDAYFSKDPHEVGVGNPTINFTRDGFDYEVNHGVFSRSGDLATFIQRTKRGKPEDSMRLGLVVGIDMNGDLQGGAIHYQRSGGVPSIDTLFAIRKAREVLDALRAQ